MYRVSAQKSSENRAERTEQVASVPEGAGHGQYARAKTGFKQVNNGFLVPVRIKKKIIKN